MSALEDNRYASGVFRSVPSGGKTRTLSYRVVRTWSRLQARSGPGPGETIPGETESSLARLLVAEVS
jgi:hypothetical protein